MNRVFNKRNLLLFNIPGLTIDEIDLEKYKAARGLYIEDPWERVKSIFLRDDHGNRHPEFVYAVHMAETGFLFGIMYGGVKRLSNKAREFHYSNDANLYQNRRHAIKAFTDFQILNFFRGGVKWGFAFAFFLGSFVFVSSCCELYRNKPKIIDSVVAGAVTGSLCKFMFGIKGMISGAVVGSVLGSIHGVTIWGLTTLTKTSQTELKYAQFAFSKYRKEYVNRLSLDPKVNEMRAKMSEGNQEGELHPLHEKDPLQNLNVGKLEAVKTEAKSNEVKNTEKKIG